MAHHDIARVAYRFSQEIAWKEIIGGAAMWAGFCFHPKEVFNMGEAAAFLTLRAIELVGCFIENYS